MECLYNIIAYTETASLSLHPRRFRFPRPATLDVHNPVQQALKICPSDAIQSHSKPSSFSLSPEAAKFSTDVRDRSEVGLSDIPPDALDHISKYLSRGRATDATRSSSLLIAGKPLNAAASRTANHAISLQSYPDGLDAKMLEGMDCTIHEMQVFIPFNIKDASEWDLMADDVPGAANTKQSETILKFMNSPDLRKLTTDTGMDQIYFDAVRHASCVQDLTISVRDSRKHRMVRNLLSRLPLLRLDLSCDAFFHRNDPNGYSLDINCFFLDEQYFSTVRNVFVDSCPELESLKISCKCSEDSSHRVLLKTIEHHRKLQEVTIRDPDIPAHILQKLRKYKCVALEPPQHRRSLLDTAMSIGSSVKTLRIWEVLSLVAVRRLADLRGLHSLQLKLQAGAEEGLLNVVHQMPELQSLFISWASVGMGPSTRHAKVNQGTVAQIGHQVGPRMREFGLIDGCVLFEEIAEVLQIFGDGLKIFKTSIFGQDEPAADRLMNILITASKHNRGLIEIDIDDSYEFYISAWTGMVEVNREKIRLAEKRLRQSAPAVTIPTFLC